MSIAKFPQLTLRDCFQVFPDPRREHLRLHSLWDIIGLSLCATICGCDTVVEIHEYGVKKFVFLNTFLDFENGVPSHDTIGRVFSLVDPRSFAVTAFGSVSRGAKHERGKASVWIGDPRAAEEGAQADRRPACRGVELKTS